MNELPIALIAFVTAALSSFVTYKIAARKSSGSVSTSTAEVLWQEANQMRKELRDEVVSLRSDLTQARLAIAKLQAKLEEVVDETPGVKQLTKKDKLS